MDAFVVPWNQMAAFTPAAQRPVSQARYFRIPHPASENFSKTLETRISMPSTRTSSDHAYVVQTGDSLSKIVTRLLQQAGQPASSSAVAAGVKHVARQNGLSNPDLIHPGQTLDLSGIGGVSPAKSVLPATLSPPRARVSLEAPAKSTPPVAKTDATGGPLSVESAPPKPYVPNQGLSDLPALPTPQPIRFKDTPSRSQEELIQAARRPTIDLTLLIDQIMAGESRVAKSESASPWRQTLEGTARLSSGYGMRKDPFTGRPAFHAGIDLAAKTGTPIHPFKPGAVTYSGWKGGYGRVVIVKHDDGIESIYGHNSKNLVQVGDRVNEQSTLGLVGSSGRSTGPHMHFEIRRNGRAVNPIPYLKNDPVHLAKAR